MSNVEGNARRQRFRWLFTIVAMLATAALIVVATVWFQDRPLTEADGELRAGRPTAALSAVEMFLQRHPADPRALQLKARALTGLQKWEDAIAIFSETGGSDAESLRAWAT